eukprot:9469250-Pyramimonas_sp.AAC.1
MPILQLSEELHFPGGIRITILCEELPFLPDTEIGPVLHVPEGTLFNFYIKTMPFLPVPEELDFADGS